MSIINVVFASLWNIIILLFIETYILRAVSLTWMILLSILLYVIILGYYITRYINLFMSLNINPYLLGFLILTPYTQTILLYLLDPSLNKLIKAAITLGIYNGLWIDRLIRDWDIKLRR